MSQQTELETIIKLLLAKKNFLVNRQTVTKFRNQKTNCKAKLVNGIKLEIVKSYSWKILMIMILIHLRHHKEVQKIFTLTIVSLKKKIKPKILSIHLMWNPPWSKKFKKKIILLVLSILVNSKINLCRSLNLFKSMKKLKKIL
jgi:hypothetical protein